MWRENFRLSFWFNQSSLQRDHHHHTIDKYLFIYRIKYAFQNWCNSITSIKHSMRSTEMDNLSNNWQVSNNKIRRQSTAQTQKEVLRTCSFSKEASSETLLLGSYSQERRKCWKAAHIRPSSHKRSSHVGSSHKRESKLSKHLKFIK